MNAIQLEVGEIPVEVVKKNVRYLRLRVCLPDGKVKVSAPRRMPLEEIHSFVVSKLPWVKQHQEKILARPRSATPEFRDGESHLVWGKSCRLKVVEVPKIPRVELHDDLLFLQVRPGADAGKRAAVLEKWYRQQTEIAALPFVAKWEPLMGVKMSRLFVRHMKSKWGTCNIRSRAIRINSELARRPRHLLEYIVVHELVHLLEPSHGPRFVKFMDRFLPNWRLLRKELR